MHPGVPERPEQHHRSPGAPGVQLLPGRRRGTRTPPSTGTRPPEDRSRIPYGRPPPRYDRPGVREHGIGSTSLPVPATRPPGTDKFVRRCRRVDQVHPRGRHGGPGLPAVQVRRTGAPRHTGAPGGRRDAAPYVPLEGRVRRVPGGARRSVPAGDVPGAPAGRTSSPYDASSPVRRGAARGHPPPRGVRHVRHAAPRRTPRRYRGAPRRPVGEPGVAYSAGGLPRGVLPGTGDAGSDRPDVPPAASHAPGTSPVRHPDRRPAVPKSAYAPAGMYRGRCTPCSPGAPPGYTTPPAIGMTSPAAA